MKRVKIRPRLQREFLAWYRENANRFAIKLRLNSRKSDCMEFGFVGITPIIFANPLYKGNLSIRVIFNGLHFDDLVWLDAYATHTPQGYFNKFLLPEFRVFHPTRKEFWRLEIFEPLLEWVNECLAQAKWVRLSRLDDEGSSWAKLIRDENELSQPDRTLVFVQSLKRIDGLPTVDRSDTLKNWLIPLRTQIPTKT